MAVPACLCTCLYQVGGGAGSARAASKVIAMSKTRSPNPAAQHQSSAPIPRQSTAVNQTAIPTQPGIPTTQRSAPKPMATTQRTAMPNPATADGAVFRQPPLPAAQAPVAEAVMAVMAGPSDGPPDRQQSPSSSDGLLASDRDKMCGTCRQAQITVRKIKKELHQLKSERCAAPPRLGRPWQPLSKASLKALTVL